MKQNHRPTTTAPRPSLFVVNGDRQTVAVCARLAEARGWLTRGYRSGEGFAARHDPAAPGCVVLRLTRRTDAAWDAVRRTPVAAPVIVVTRHDGLSAAVGIMRQGAFDYLVAPTDARLTRCVREAVRRDAVLRRYGPLLRRLRRRLRPLTDDEQQVLGAMTALVECRPGDWSGSGADDNLNGDGGARPRAAHRAGAAIEASADVADLSPRLRQTLRCLLAGDSEKEAARKLGLSHHTVHDYVKALHRHFDVRSRGELLVRCFGPQTAS